MVDQKELQFLDRRSDGLIFIAPRDRRQTLETLYKHQVPAVTCFNENTPQVPAIVLDNKDAMRQAVEHLIEHGHQRVLHLTVPTGRSDFEQRKQGFEEAMETAGLEPVTLRVENITQEPDIKRFLSMLKRHHITAVACAADTLAYCAWDIAGANSIKVPQQLSITGMDDWSRGDPRPLTTIHYSCEEVGRRAIEAVVGLIEGGDAKSVSSIVPVELVQRSSVAPA